MNYHGHARVNPRAPRAFAVCDRCGMLYNHVDLQFQYEWRGTAKQNTGRLVCRGCLDVPQEQFRTLVLSPDPVPIRNARPENYVSSETEYRVTQDGSLRIVEDGGARVLQSSATEAESEGDY